MKLPWIRVIKPEESKGLLKEIYESTRKKRGKIANIHMIHSLNPKSLEAHMNLYLSLMYGKSPLSRRERELLGVATSVTNRCEYCIEHHSDALSRYEKRADYIEYVKRGEWHKLVDKDRILCEFARKLTISPFEVNESDIEKLRDAGYDDSAILDIVQVIAYFNFVNRLVLGLGVPLENESEREGYKY